MGTRRTLIVVLIVASFALGACTRERQSDRAAARPSPTGAAIRDANETADPAQSSAHAIAIVPASEELMRRAAAGGTTIRKILAAAQSTIGTPYKWGAANLRSGIDCSHYTWLLYRSIGVP